jgi:3-hydroxypropanoate dehydrogenase
MFMPDDRALDVIFRKARTHDYWQPKPVTDETLHQVYDLMKWGPTSANCSPARILFLRSKEAKERLRPALSNANTEKTMLAPVTAVIAYDLTFYDMLPKLFPKDQTARSWFAGKEPVIQATAFRNGTLQGAYMIMAARAVGLDCGPMSGFDTAKVDQEFFAGQPVKTNFLCNLGYGDPSKLGPQPPRMSFDEVCKVL